MKRRDTRRVARADLIWVAIGFVALQAGLAVASRTWLPELHDPYYAYKAARLRGRMEAGPQPPVSAVMLGSSRTAFGFRGTDVEAIVGRDLGRPVVAYNFGLYGGGPVTELLVLRRLLADGLRPNVVLAEVIPAFLSDGAGAAGELPSLSPTRLELAEAGWLEQYGRAGDRLHRDWWEANLVPWHGYRFAIVSRLAPRCLPSQLRLNFGDRIDASGWEEPRTQAPTPENRRAATEMTRASFAPTMATFHLGGPSCQGLRDLLGLCRAERLPVALVVMPESSAFRGWYPPAVRTQIDAYLTGLSCEFGSPLVSGAAVFSARLAGDVTRLLRPTDPEASATDTSK
jgi:hypothetical protein